MLEALRELSLLNGISGREDEVREYIIDKVRDSADSMEVDPSGNLIVFRRGAQTPPMKVMLDAHMDEVGMIITAVRDDGTLSFERVGGISPYVMYGKPVSVGVQRIPGAIGVKPVHLVPQSEKLTVPEDMYIDIGAENRKDALRLVKPGDFACFDSEFTEFGDGFVKGKALDDRAGCAILIDMINSELPCDMYFCFSAGEEVGLGMAGTAAYRVRPDRAIVVETTTAADVAGVPANKTICRLGDGAVISFMDKRTVYPARLFERALELARRNGIKAQVKSAVSGGNNAGAIHKTAGGVGTVAVSVPCRYLHSPSCVLKTDDVTASARLVALLAEDLAYDKIDIR